MTEIIFCRPVHHYDSYLDFWKLVELSNFPVILADQIDLTKLAVYITAPMNGDFQEYMVGNLQHWQETGEITGGEITRQKTSGLPRMAHIILWNLERPGGSANSFPQYVMDNWKLIHSRIVDEIWVSDSTMADESMFRYVKLGSDYGLGEPGENKSYDFTHQSVAIPRRANIYKHFGDSQIGQNCWPPKRDEVLQQSKFALNVHQDDFPYCEPLRIALFAAYGLPVISETLTHPHIYDGIAEHNYGGLVSGLKQALNDDYGDWRQRGLRLREKLCNEFQFGKVVREAVKERVGEWR